VTRDNSDNQKHFHVVYHKEKARSSYRLIDRHSNEIIPVNEFLDSVAIRGFSSQTLRTYAYALLNVWKWMTIKSVSIEKVTGAHLIEYIRYVRENAKTPPAPRSINLRLVVLRSPLINSINHTKFRSTHIRRFDFEK